MGIVTEASLLAGSAGECVGGRGGGLSCNCLSEVGIQAPCNAGKEQVKRCNRTQRCVGSGTEK
jgi:hypothetical protein